ncbi:MAG: hypothetical protein QNL70_03575 [Pseudomonas sp.]
MAKVIARIKADLPRLMEVKEFREMRYAGRNPSLQLLKKWIAEGEMPGEVRGGEYFVDLQAVLLGSDDPLLAKMLEV